MEKFSSQWMTELATEEKNDDFSAKQVQSQRRKHRVTDVNCSKTIRISALLPEKPWINPCKNSSHNNPASKACSNSAVKTHKQGCWTLPWCQC